MEPIAVQGSALVVVVGLVGLWIRLQAKDRGGGWTLAAERLVDLQALRIAHGLLEQRLEAETASKHLAITAAAREQMRVDLARTLAWSCTCSAMNPFLAALIPPQPLPEAPLRPPPDPEE